MADRVCLYCGSIHGTPSEVPETEIWFWKILRYGRVGPFCLEAHANSFAMPTSGTNAPVAREEPENAPRYTVQEWEQLQFLRYRWEHQPAP